MIISANLISSTSRFDIAKYGNKMVIYTIKITRVVKVFLQHRFQYSYHEDTHNYREA